MTKQIRFGEGEGGVVRRLMALVLTICLLTALATEALASSAGSSASSVTVSSVKSYVDLPAASTLIDPDGKTITLASRAVLQLASTDYYISDGKEYYVVYYGNRRHSVLRNINQVMTAAQLATYISGTVWATGTGYRMEYDNDLIGDVNVHALQLALSNLGYYSGKLDGNFGSGTRSAVRAFQRAYKLSVDGVAGPDTLTRLYALAVAGGTGGLIPSPSGTVGTLKTNVSVNLRKSASKSSPRLAIVPRKTSLSYSDATTTGGITWYKVKYGENTGWLMGNYVTASGGGGGGGGGGTSLTQLGTVTITKRLTAVRNTANGSRSGYIVNTGDVLPLYSQAVTAGSYSWYYIRTSNGVYGYVRGDCCTANYYTSPITPSTAKSYVLVPAAGVTVFTSKEKSATGAVAIPGGTYLQLLSTDTYKGSDDVTYWSLYYNNQVYNSTYTDLKDTVVGAENLTKHITGTLWPRAYIGRMDQTMGLIGNIDVHAAQLALSILGYYAGLIDGTYASDTAAAVKAFQRAYRLDRDGIIGPDTYDKLFPAAILAYGGTSPADFGIVKQVVRASWNYDDNGAGLYPKYAYAMLMDVETRKTFRVYRIYGGNHADCVPATSADTKLLCDVVGFTYNAEHPTSSQLQQIINDTSTSNAKYTWPDFKASWGGTAKAIGSAWDYRPCWLNVDGTVYCVAVYGWPHGYNGSDSSLKRWAPSNNYYGMMCVHFYNSSGHSDTTKGKHNDAVDKAYNTAKSVWPGLVK